MIDWDEDGETELEDIGLSAMMIDDLEKETPPRKKNACFHGCLSATILLLVVIGAIVWILSVIP